MKLGLFFVFCITVLICSCVDSHNGKKCDSDQDKGVLDLTRYELVLDTGEAKSEKVRVVFEFGFYNDSVRLFSGNEVYVDEVITTGTYVAFIKVFEKDSVNNLSLKLNSYDSFYLDSMMNFDYVYIVKDSGLVKVHMTNKQYVYK